MALLVGDACDWEGVFKAGPPHRAVGCVDFVSCRCRCSNVADTCGGLIQAVSQFCVKDPLGASQTPSVQLPVKVLTLGMGLGDNDLPEVIKRTVLGLSVIWVMDVNPWRVHCHGTR